MNFRPGRAWQKPVPDPSAHHPSIQKCWLVSADVTFLISAKLEQFPLLFLTLSVSRTGESGKNTFKEHWHYQLDVSYVHLALTNTGSWVLSLGKLLKAVPGHGCARSPWGEVHFPSSALCQKQLPTAGSGWRNAHLYWVLSSWLTVNF